MITFKNILILAIINIHLVVLNLASAENDFTKPSLNISSCKDLQESIEPASLSSIFNFSRKFENLKSSNQFCQNPIKAICHDNNYRSFNCRSGSWRVACFTDQNDKQKIENIFSLIRPRIELALKFHRSNLLPTGPFQNNIEWWTALEENLLKAKWSPKRIISFYRKFRIRAFRKHFRNRFSKQNKRFYSKLREVYPQVQELLISEVEKKTFLSKQVRDEMIKKIEEVKLVSYDKANRFERYIYKRECDGKNKDMSSGNAFFRLNEMEVWSDGTIYVCPGNALDIKNLGSSETLVRQGLLATLSHELGHVIDHDNFGDSEFPLSDLIFPTSLYQHMNVCIEKLHGKKLSHDKNKYEEYRREIRADYWSHQTTGQYLRIFKKGGYKSRLNFLRKTYSWLCGKYKERGDYYGDEGRDGDEVKVMHPSHNFRINMMRRHPEISKMMGCNQNTIYERKPYCGIKGEQ